jgi:hypothetical protein
VGVGKQIFFALLIAAAAAGPTIRPAGAAPPSTQPAVSTAGAPKSFPSPEAAAQGLIDALKSGNRQAALDILGHSSAEWLSSGDRVADRAAVAHFIAEYEEKHALEKEGDARAILIVGHDDYPFPFPLIGSNGGWRFDPEQGREEILNRRVGRNELSTIQTLRAIVDAQHEYASQDRNGDGLLEYAQKFISSPGKKDGLYWPAKPGEPDSPLGPLIGEATREGYKKQAGTPTAYHGYYYRMLTKQGPAANGGAYDYLVRKDVMIGGFAVLAYPAKYGVSGIMSFLVNQQGVVFEKDLGPDTGKAAGRITTFNPDRGWRKD